MYLFSYCGRSSQYIITLRHKVVTDIYSSCIFQSLKRLILKARFSKKYRVLFQLHVYSGWDNHLEGNLVLFHKSPIFLHLIYICFRCDYLLSRYFGTWFNLKLHVRVITATEANSVLMCWGKSVYQYERICLQHFWIFISQHRAQTQATALLTGWELQPACDKVGTAPQ